MSLNAFWKLIKINAIIIYFIICSFLFKTYFADAVVIYVRYI